jgi:uncharacterized secreted protein with C-terminal beta-propeller domain
MKKWAVPMIFLTSVCASIAVVELVGELAGVWAAVILPTSIWCLLEGGKPTKSLLAAVALISMIAVAFTIPALSVLLSGRDGENVGLRKFSSYSELKSFVQINPENYYGHAIVSPVRGGLVPVPTPTIIAGTVMKGTEVDFSTTNIQVEGVDEADLVKCDGRYLYVLSGRKVFVIYAYPPENASITSEIQENENPIELFINGDRLVILGENFAKIYDVSNRENPVLKREVYFDGWYFNSRMIGDYVYLIVSSPSIYFFENEIDLPSLTCNGRGKTIQATDIYYFENLHGYSYQFTTILAINTQNDFEEISSETFLMTTAQNLFVSLNHIYITYTNYWVSPRNWSVSAPPQEEEKTLIHKIAVSGGRIEYRAGGEVLGWVLNQFSMDEYQGYFRIATSTGWYGANHLYVLDQDLNIIGRLENLAPGEMIYSARFMGSRAYMVTFKKVDPLFVIDLTDPANPTVLGRLKIPGYSDYLHPYDDTHLIGVGKDTTESDEGDFAWYQGVKVALFDVSDPENPVELSKYVVGQRGTESLALYDHKAFLFSRSRNLLVLPIGDWAVQDAYVFHISLDGGIMLRGTITHLENQEWQWAGWYSVKRSLYVEGVLYTVSNGLVRMNSLGDLSEMGSVLLSEPEWEGVVRPMILQ